VRTLRSSVLVEGDPGLVHAMVSVDDGDPYQLLFGVRSHLPDTLHHAVIGELDGRVVYDAPQDAELMGPLLDLFLSQGTVAGLRFETAAPVKPGLRPRPVGVEQSNTSLIFGNQILKLYRQPEAGRNRDVDLHRALAGNPHIAAPLGVLTDERPQEPVVLGFMQRFLPDAVEGWATATASVRDLLAEGDLHADEVGGDFAGEAGRPRRRAFAWWARRNWRPKWTPCTGGWTSCCRRSRPWPRRRRPCAPRSTRSATSPPRSRSTRSTATCTWARYCAPRQAGS
jgi:maltokinase